MIGLARRCGFEPSGVFVMDGSRRSAHGNAYFTGIGRTKRIVFFDTLLEALAPGEVEAVLAHELGHFRLRHVAWRIGWSLAASFAGFALLAWLAGQSWFQPALGVRGGWPAHAVPAVCARGPGIRAAGRAAGRLAVAPSRVRSRLNSRPATPTQRRSPTRS